MTIDEAIARERQHAKDKRKEMQCKTCKLFARNDLHPLQGYCRKNEFRSIEIDSWRKVCSEYVPKEMCKCAEEHEQLAEWLEELKSYRASVFSGDMTQKMLKEEYCKAVDDFAESVKNLIADSSVIRFKDIDEIAEQLKAGDGE